MAAAVSSHYTHLFTCLEEHCAAAKEKYKVVSSSLFFARRLDEALSTPPRTNEDFLHTLALYLHQSFLLDPKPVSFDYGTYSRAKRTVDQLDTDPRSTASPEEKATLHKLCQRIDMLATAIFAVEEASSRLTGRDIAEYMDKNSRLFNSYSTCYTQNSGIDHFVAMSQDCSAQVASLRAEYERQHKADLNVLLREKA